MNIVSDAQSISNPNKFEYNLLGLILYSFKYSRGWQIANSFNIFFNLGMLFIISNQMSNMFSLIAMILGLMAFIGKLSDAHTKAEEDWNRRTVFQRQTGGSISD